MHARPNPVLTASLRVIALLAASTLTIATPAGAQAICNVDESNPSQLGKALVAVTMAQNVQAAGKTEDAAKQLQGAVKTLTDSPDKIKNALGRQLVLGRALAIADRVAVLAGGRIAAEVSRASLTEAALQSLYLSATEPPA